MEKEELTRPEVPEVSKNAFARLLALRLQEVEAIRQMVKSDSYSDFFVEGSGPPWHEAFEDVITGGRSLKEMTPSRMAFVDRLREVTDDGYSDFFVEGSGPPWHEAFEDVITGRRLEDDFHARMHALSQLNVMQAYVRLREGAMGNIKSRA